MAYTSKTPKFISETLTDQGSDPATPSAGSQVIYTKSGGVFVKNSAGTVAQLTTGSVGVATSTVTGTVTSYVPVVVSAVKTVSSANYTVLDADGYSTILVTTGASNRTITMPTAANNAGRTLVITKVDSGVGFVLTSGATGAATKLFLQYESMRLACDGTTWYITGYSENKAWTSYSPTTSGFGTISSNQSYWRRNGTSMDFLIRFVAGTVASSEAQVGIPLSLTIASLMTGYQYLGRSVRANAGGTNVKGFTVMGISAGTKVIFGEDDTAAAVSPFTLGQNGDVVATSSAAFSCFFSVPISEWQ